MRVYMIMETKKVTIQKEYDEYIRKVPRTVKKYGGKYLARCRKISVLSGDWRPQRLILIRFPSTEKFKAWWSSPEYGKVAPLRERSAKVNAVVLSGKIE